MKNLKLLSLVIVAFLTFNCSSDDDSNAPELTTHNLLMSGKWFITASGGEIPNDCQKQTYFHFTDTDTMIYEGFATDEDTDECESQFLLTTSYTLMNNDTELKVIADFGITVFNIELISRTKLILSTESDIISFGK